MSLHKNRVKMTSATTGTGTLTLGSASIGYQSFATAYGADATVDILITEGTAWEVARDCAYTNSGTTVSRGTLEASSTGIAVNCGGTQVVSVIHTAGAGQQTALNHVALADANTTMVVGSMYVGSMAAWATADRTYTLPTTANVGDRIGVMITGGNATYELILTAGTSDTLNGIAGGTEWSRLFITNEVVIMRCVTANSAWVVEQDGRIPQMSLLSLTTSASAEAVATFVRPTDQSGAWTAKTDNASISTVSTGQIKTRRAGYFELSFFGTSVSVISATEFYSTAIYLSGTANILCASTFASPGPASAGQQTGAHVGSYPLAVDDYIVYQYRSSQGSKGLSASTSPRVGAWFSLTEVI